MQFSFSDSCRNKTLGPVLAAASGIKPINAFAAEIIAMICQRYDENLIHWDEGVDRWFTNNNQFTIYFFNIMVTPGLGGSPQQ